MNDSPFFSIIVPTYNPPDLVFRTLDSVLDQSFRDYEILVIDDCSPQDVSVKLARYIQAGQIRYVRNERNAERAVTRNHGLREARGQWATFLDHDDLMYPSCLDEAHRFITSHPDIRFVHNLNELVDPLGKPLRKYRVSLTSDPAWDIVNGNFLACIGAYVRRDVFEKVQFDESIDLLWSEDYEYWLRVLAHTEKLGRIEKINSGIVEHPGRTVHRVALERTVRRAQYIIQKVRSDAACTGFYSETYLNRFEAISYLVVAMAFESAAQYGSSARFLLKTLGADLTVLFFPLYLRSVARMPYRAVTRLLTRSSGKRAR